MIKFFERLFCKHKYAIDSVEKKYEDSAGCLKSAVFYFLECKECGKRRVVPPGWLTYSSQTKELFRLWERKEIEIDFNNAADNKKGEGDWTEEQLDS